jgi:hypothetical protein
MCCSCHFYCCAMDTFGGCGCDSCYDPDCWPEEDDDEFGSDDDYGECSSQPASRLRCDTVWPGNGECSRMVSATHEAGVQPLGACNEQAMRRTQFLSRGNQK